MNELAILSGGPTDAPIPPADLATSSPSGQTGQVASASPPAPIRGFDSAWLVRVPIFDIDAEPSEAGLHPAEVAEASIHKPRRRRELLAGRQALRSALRAAGWSGDEPLLPGEQGRPNLPEGFTGSLTHKDGLVLAVAGPLRGGVTLGVDSEVLGTRERVGIARKILRPAEAARWEAAGSTWPDLLELFSVKEAIYKAMHPHVPRYIAFDEAEVEGRRLTMHLARGEGDFNLQGHWWWEADRLISVVSARRG